MLNPRYVSATNGKITVFRATSGPYQAAVFASRQLPTGRHVLDGRILLSRLDAVEGGYPVTVISRSEYQALYGKALDRLMALPGPLIVTPQECWFANPAAVDSTQAGR